MGGFVFVVSSCLIVWISVCFDEVILLRIIGVLVSSVLLCGMLILMM